MRKTKSKILILFILSSLYSLISCNDDELHEYNHGAKTGIKSSKITFNEFKKHCKAFNLITDLNKKQSESNSILNKIVEDTINNFTIETQEGLYLQYANLHSFTFPIHREEDNDKLENLVLSYQNDGSYKVKILKYDLTPQEKIDLELGQLKTIQNPIITMPIENFDTNLVVNACETVTETIYVSCSSGNHSFGSGNAMSCAFWGNLSSGTPPRVYTRSRIKCLDADGNTGGNTGGDGSWNPPGGSGSGDYPIEYPTLQTIVEDYELGISAPVKPSLDIDLPIYENFPSENITQLEDFLEVDSFGLIVIPCNQIIKWQALAQYNLPISTINKISNLQYQNSSAVPNWDIQFVAGAEGTTVNMDFFPITISVFPNNPSTNQPYTPQEFYNFFRRNLNTFVTGIGVSFAPSTITGQNESLIWNSSNPLDAVISINMQPDSGSVICSNYTNSHWYFTTLTTPWAPDFGDDDNDGLHPVSGNREFGYYLDNNGNYVFYVRGVDRIQRSSAAAVASIVYSESPFQGADEVWNKMKQNMVNFVNNGGGTAVGNINEIFRPDWNKVKEVLRGNRPISDLGCN